MTNENDENARPRLSDGAALDGLGLSLGIEDASKEERDHVSDSIAELYTIVLVLVILVVDHRAQVLLAFVLSESSHDRVACPRLMQSLNRTRRCAIWRHWRKYACVADETIAG